MAAKPPDGLGIYDMMGNIEEWVQDYYSERAYLLPSKTRPSTGTKRVFRGGSCITPIKTLYPARRFSASIDSSYWFFAGKEVKSSREKNCPGKAPNLVKV